MDFHCSPVAATRRKHSNNHKKLIREWLKRSSSVRCSVEPDSMCSYVSSLSGRTWMSRTGSDPLCLILLATKKEKTKSYITWVFIFIIADKTLQERIVNSSFNISLSFFFFVLFIASTKRVCELTFFFILFCSINILFIFGVCSLPCTLLCACGGILYAALQQQNSSIHKCKRKKEYFMLFCYTFFTLRCATINIFRNR